MKLYLPPQTCLIPVSYHIYDHSSWHNSSSTQCSWQYLINLFGFPYTAITMYYWSIVVDQFNLWIRRYENSIQLLSPVLCTSLIQVTILVKMIVQAMYIDHITLFRRSYSYYKYIVPAYVQLATFFISGYSKDIHSLRRHHAI